MGTTLGSLRLDLGLQLAKFQSDMGKAAHIADQGFKRIEALGKRIAHVLEFQLIGEAARRVFEQVKKAAEEGSRLVDLSQKTGIAVGELSKLKIVAADNSVKFDQLEGSLVRFNKSISEAAGGAKEQATAFKLLGITQEDLKRLSPQELFLKTADALAQYEDGANKARLAQALFGKEGADLIPLLNQGGAAIKAAADEAERLGLTLSKAQAEQLKGFNDQIDKSKQVTEAFRNRIAIGLTPALTALLKQFDDAATNADALDEAERRAAAGGRVLAIGAVVVTSAVTGLGKTIGGVAAALSRLLEGVDLANLANPLTAIFEQGKMAKNASATLEILKNLGHDLSAGLSDEMSKIDRILNEKADSIAASGKKIKDGFREQAPNLEGKIKADEASAKAASDAEKAADKARAAIERQIQTLEQQVVSLDKSAASAMAYRVTQGDIAEQLKLAGANAANYADRLIGLAHTQDMLKKESEDLQDLQERLNREYERNEDVITGLDPAMLDYQHSVAELADLLDHGRISQEQFNAAVARLKDLTKPIDRIKDAAKDIEGAFEDAFAGLFENLNNARDVFQSFVSDIQRILARLAAQKLVDQLFNRTGTNTDGDWLGSLISTVGGLFGGARTPDFNVSPGISGQLAIGGPAMPNSIYRVAENGPELANIGGKSYLMTGSAGGGVTPARAANDVRPITVIQHIHTPDIGSFKASGTQIAASAFAQAARAHARNR